MPRGSRRSRPPVEVALARPRRPARHRARVDAEVAARRTALLGELARSTITALELDPILQMVAAGARELCRSDLSAIALREPDTGAMVFRHRAGERLYDDARLVVLPGRGAGGLVLTTGQPVRSDDTARDPRFAGDAEYLAAVAREKIVAVMAVPIVIGAQVEGLLYVDNRTGQPFSDDDEVILRQLADHAAIAIRNAQLLAAAQRARDEAETANRMKDEFLATLSHELRTPLNAVLGWAVTLRTARLDGAAAGRALEAIERNARAQSQLIEDLLDISRIVNGKLSLDVRLVDLRAGRGGGPRCRPPRRAREGARAGAGAGRGHHARRSQSPAAGVWNLLSNAIKFTARGGRIDVGLADGAEAAEITVRDTGQGIAPGLLPFVFDRFRQADSSSTRNQSGLGIGLALVKSLTELHGGSVLAESAGVGQGATFRLRFPGLASPAGVETRQPRRALASGPVASLAGVRILVVEDDRDSRELIGGVLARGGAEVRTAAGADPALATLADWRADVIVTDIEMPDDDGYALLRRVRALPEARGAGVPVVALTAHAGPEDGARLLAAGFQVSVPKPVEPAELVALVARVARSPRAA